MSEIYKMLYRPMIGPFILMYHSIADDMRDPYAVSVAGFRQQVSWLSKKGFVQVSLAFLTNAIKTGDFRSLNKKVVFTFDDGCDDFTANALPVLRDYGATATVFLVTGMFGCKASWSTYSKDVSLMSEDQLSQVKAHGISLGSHTVNHEDLTVLGVEELHEQLKHSHEKLVELGETFYALSYPWGRCSAKVVEAAKASGYACALGAGGTFRQNEVDMYCLPRISMRGDMDIKSFRAIFSPMSTIKGIIRGCGVSLKGNNSAASSDK